MFSPPESSKAPVGCIWIDQIREPLTWFTSFWNCHGTENIVRIFGIDAHFNRGKAIMIYVDASPYGLGAWLSVDAVPTAFFSDIITDMDCAMLLVEKNIGSKGQQAFEALGLLAAIRLWLPSFREERITVYLRSDNLSALEMVAKMQPKSKALGVVARELALDLSSASYALDFAQHVAGITNGIADSLSRKNQPGKSYELHHLLKDAREDAPQPRDINWWKSKSAGVGGLLDWSRSFDA